MFSYVKLSDKFEFFEPLCTFWYIICWGLDVKYMNAASCNSEKRWIFRAKTGVTLNFKKFICKF